MVVTTLCAITSPGVLKAPRDNQIQCVLVHDSVHMDNFTFSLGSTFIISTHVHRLRGSKATASIVTAFILAGTFSLLQHVACSKNLATPRVAVMAVHWLNLFIRKHPHDFVEFVVVPQASVTSSEKLVSYLNPKIV